MYDIVTVPIYPTQKNVSFMIGKNAQGNDCIISASKSTDIWFHLANQPSCHVVAVIPDDVTKKEKGYIIRKGAELCKQRSKERSSTSVGVIYTKIQNVLKTDVLGCVNTTDCSQIVI